MVQFHQEEPIKKELIMNMLNKIEIIILNINEEIKRNIGNYTSSEYFFVTHSTQYNMNIINIHFLNDIIMQIDIRDEISIKEIEYDIKISIKEIIFILSKIKLN